VRKLGSFLLLVGCVIWFAACGGSGNSNTGTVTSVTVSCSPSTITSGQTSQCTATVTGTGNFSSNVTWTASAGTISTSGLFTGPQTDVTLLATITATSTQNTSISGTANVTVNPNNSTVTGVSVSCTPSMILSQQTSQCTATVTGTGNFSNGVTWTATPTGGTISSSGLFTAPTVSSPTTFTITATSTQNTNVSGTATVTVNPGTSAPNVAAIIVDNGPAPTQFSSVNVPYVTVRVCGPTTCQDIDHVQVDTGSEGLRLLSSDSGGEFNPGNLGLSAETIGGTPVDECLVFADGFVWGPVYTATVMMSGETASNVPIHVIIPSSDAPGVPTTCSNQNPQGGNGNEGGSLMALGSNGIIGVGLFQTDCGNYCVTSGQQCNGTMSAPCVYYTCPPSGNCVPTNVPLAQQLPNPVIAFATDNNGVLIQLPSVPNGGSQNVVGSLVFGIGTQSNNALNLAANVYQVPNCNPRCAMGVLAGDLITTFNGKAYNQSFLDSGSNGLFFLDSSTTGIPTCPDPNQGWYCPSTSPDNLTVTNQGQDSNGNGLGNPVQANFSIEQATTLFNTTNTAFSTLGGPNTGAFDFGLTFFFGKNVFTAIDGASIPGQGNLTGPFVAY
jgi:hypothetical protein